jgi:hypothetical protein
MMLVKQREHRSAVEKVEHALVQKESEHGASSEKVVRARREFSDMFNSFASAILEQKPLPKGSLKEAIDLLHKASDLLKNDNAPDAISHKTLTLSNTGVAYVKSKMFEKAVGQAKTAVVMLSTKQDFLNSGKWHDSYNVVQEREDKELLATAYHTLGLRHKQCRCVSLKRFVFSDPLLS